MKVNVQAQVFEAYAVRSASIPYENWEHAASWKDVRQSRDEMEVDEQDGLEFD